MNIFVSAKLSPEAMNTLYSRANVIEGGWGATGKKLTPAELVEQASGCEIMIICYEEINDYVLSSLPMLRLVACTRGGAENIDREAVRRHPSVLVTNAPGRNANAVAEFTIGLILAAARHIPRTHRFIMNRDWARVPWDVKGSAPKKTFEGFELEGKILGLIGFGSIGRIVARLARAFGMSVKVYDPYLSAKDAGDGVELTNLDNLLANSDVISLHAKVTDETKDMINTAVFRKMKAEAIFVNTARGVLVNEKDLYEALQNNVIACAALDVQVQEPMEYGSPLLELDNIILTPHIGGATGDILFQQSKIVMEDVLGYLEEGRPIHVLK